MARNLKEAHAILQAIEDAGILHGYLKTRSTLPPSPGERSWSGGEVHRWPGGRIWLGPPRNTVVPTGPGFGGVTSKGAASFRT